MSKQFFWPAMSHLKIFSQVPRWKSGRERKKQFIHDLLSILIISKVKYRLSLHLLFIWRLFRQYNLSYSTLKSFVFGRFLWISNQENKRKKVNFPIFIVLNIHAESKIRKSNTSPSNVNVPNYVIEQTPVLSLAGGALVYINNKLSYKTMYWS